MGTTIKLAVKEVAEEKGTTNPFALATKAGLNYAICHRLWQGGQQRIDLKTIARLCEALGCDPCDLIVYTPNKKGSKK